MQYSLIHPSRNRPKKANQTIKNWLSKADNKSEIEYILSIDKDDRDLSRYKAIGLSNGTYVAINRNKSAIQAINNAAKVSNGRILIVVSDDFDCPKGWDTLLANEINDKEDFILKTQDGIQEWIITLPILDRKYYNRFGYIYYPGYMHLFCDTEMTSVADLTGRKLTSGLLFEHMHYSKGKSKKDAVNIKNDLTWNQGKKLYNQRKSINFGL